MADYETELYIAMHSYPSQFPTEWCALASFLFVLGNGMEWIDGELTRDYHEYSDDPDWEVALIRARRIQDAERATSKFDDAFSGMTLYRQERYELALAPTEEQWRREIEYRRSRVSKTSMGYKHARECWRPFRGNTIAEVAYPCGEGYGAINNIPEFVTPSWMVALKKCRAYIISRHIQFRSADEKRHALMRLNQAIKD